MLAAAFALIIAGAVLSLFLGYFGFIVSGVGLFLLVLAVIGLVGRRSAGAGAEGPP